jgi:glycerol dehydrogenase-like iron-containing ADH family enzyme
MMGELAARFDPTVDDSNDPLGVAYGTVMQMLTSWRENAWRNAEALVNAPNPTARSAVAAYIESEADTVALTLRRLGEQVSDLPPNKHDPEALMEMARILGALAQTLR